MKSNVAKNLYNPPNGTSIMSELCESFQMSNCYCSVDHIPDGECTDAVVLATVQTKL